MYMLVSQSHITTDDQSVSASWLVKVKVTLRPTTSRSVRLGFESYSEQTSYNIELLNCWLYLKIPNADWREPGQLTDI
jgi:hypothetical protein